MPADFVCDTKSNLIYQFNSIYWFVNPTKIPVFQQKKHVRVSKTVRQVGGWWYSSQGLGLIDQRWCNIWTHRGVESKRPNQPTGGGNSNYVFFTIFHPENWGRFWAIWTVAYFSKGAGEKTTNQKIAIKSMIFGGRFFVSWEIHVGSQMPGNI